jgi:alpha-galactosidase
VLGLYRLLDDLRRAFPWLEIETCASGGARADLGILQRTRRIWVSDCNDPLERQRMHRALLTFLPAEIMGVHVGARRSHTTGRHADIALRTLTALFGHPGIEADPRTFSEEEASHLRQAIAFYKAERAWLAQAEVSAVDHEDPAVLATSAIASDGRRALVTVVAVDRTADAVPGPLRVPGLVAQGRYRVGLHPLWPADPRHGKLPAGPFQSEDCLTLDGRVLRDAGLALPILLPGTGILLVLDQIE